MKARNATHGVTGPTMFTSLRRISHGACLCLALGSLACGSTNVQKVRVPPRVDLGRYETVGMITFRSDSVPGLADRAGNTFLAKVMGAQPGVAVLELGELGAVLRSVDASTLDANAIRALGAEHGVDAILVGRFESAAVRPKFSVNALAESLSARAEIEGSLSARLYVARSGATVWTNTARGKRTLAHLDLVNHSRPSMGGSSLDETRTELLAGLADTLTADFHSRWVRP